MEEKSEALTKFSLPLIANQNLSSFKIVCPQFLGGWILEEEYKGAIRTKLMFMERSLD